MNIKSLCLKAIKQVKICPVCFGQLKLYNRGVEKYCQNTNCRFGVRPSGFIGFEIDKISFLIEEHSGGSLDFMYISLSKRLENNKFKLIIGDLRIEPASRTFEELIYKCKRLKDLFHD